MMTIDIKLPAGIAGIESAVSASLPEIARAVRNDISTFATKELKLTSLDYRRGLQMSSFAVSSQKLRSGGTYSFAVITLAGWLANAIEDGWEGGDMVPALLRGRSGRDTKNGKRIAIVHFRQQQAGTAGVAGGVMGGLEAKRGMNRQQAALVGKAITAAAKGLSANESGHGGKPKRLTQAVASRAGAQILRGTAAGARKHSSSIYAGMRKNVDSAGTTYSTFRTVSATASSGKFLHPGITARHFFDKALKRLDGHARMVINHHIEGLSS